MRARLWLPARRGNSAAARVHSPRVRAFAASRRATSGDHEAGHLAAHQGNLPHQCGRDGRTAGEAGRNTVCTSGAIAPFIPAISIS